VSQKVPTFKPSVTCQILTDFHNYWTTGNLWNLLQNQYDIIHLTLGMLLHYVGILKIQIFVDVEENANKFQESSKVKTFLRHSVDCHVFYGPQRCTAIYDNKIWRVWELHRYGQNSKRVESGHAKKCKRDMIINKFDEWISAGCSESSRRMESKKSK